MTFIAGAYTATYDDVTIGTTDGGFTLRYLVNKQLITPDSLGAIPQDAVYQGKEMFVLMNLIQSTDTSGTVLPKPKLAFWPYATTGSGATLAGDWGTPGVIGRTDVGSSIVQELVLTATAGTPAASSPASVTFPRAIVAEDVPIRIPLQSSAIRNYEITMRIYPDSSGVFFTTT